MLFNMEKKRGLISIGKPTIKYILLVSMFFRILSISLVVLILTDAFMKIFLLESKCNAIGGILIL